MFIDVVQSTLEWGRTKRKTGWQNNLVFLKVKKRKLGITMPPCGRLMQVVNEDKHVILMLFFILKSYY